MTALKDRIRHLRGADGRHHDGYSREEIGSMSLEDAVGCRCGDSWEQLESTIDDPAVSGNAIVVKSGDEPIDGTVTFLTGGLVAIDNYEEEEHGR